MLTSSSWNTDPSISNSLSSQWHHKLHIIKNNESSLRKDRIKQWSWLQSAQTLDDRSALLKSCHQREGQRLHCMERKSRAKLSTSCWLFPPINKVRMETGFNRAFDLLEINEFSKRTDLQWGKEPRQTALLRIVTRNMWQFLKSDSILSIDSILKENTTRSYKLKRVIAAHVWWMWSSIEMAKQNNGLSSFFTVLPQSYNSGNQCHCYFRTLTSKLQIQLAIGLRRWGLNWEPSLSPPSQNWPEKTQQSQTHAHHKVTAQLQLRENAARCCGHLLFSSWRVNTT